MAKSISKTEKKRGPGRPFIGATQIQVRMPPDELAALDGWIARQGGPLTRPEAIRQLVGKAIGPSARRPSKASAHRASKLATREIESLIDKSEPTEMQERRKRRLIHGPKEFRGIRADQPKRKE